VVQFANFLYKQNIKLSERELCLYILQIGNSMATSRRASHSNRRRALSGLSLTPDVSLRRNEQPVGHEQTSAKFAFLTLSTHRKTARGGLSEIGSCALAADRMHGQSRMSVALAATTACK
jgi:hypothetical protein